MCYVKQLSSSSACQGGVGSVLLSLNDITKCLKNARLIQTTENGGLGEHIDSIVMTKSVTIHSTKKFGIHPEEVWTIEECKKKKKK